MDNFVEIVKSRRKELLIAWGVFCLWVVSQYIYHYQAGEAYSFSVAFEYIAGFTKYMILPWFLVFVIALAGYVLGRMFFAVTAGNVKFKSGLQESLWAIGTGMGLIAVLTYLMGLARLLYPFIFVLLFIFLLAGGYKHIIHLWKIIKKGLRPLDWDLLDWTLFVLFAGMIANTFFLVCNPTITYDSLTYHLVAPRYYLNDHAIIYHPWIHFNSFPQLQEMLLMLQMMVIKDPGGSLSYFYTILAAAVIYTTGERYFGRRSGAIAAILFMLIREVHQDSKVALVENILVFYTLLLLEGVLVWAETKDRRWAVLIGTAGGLACGVKYFGIPTVLFTVLIMAIAYFLPRFKWERMETEITPVEIKETEVEENNSETNKKNSKLKKNNKKNKAELSPKVKAKMIKAAKPVKPLGPISLIGSIGLVILWTAIIGSPWYLRNIVLFANPFFPFYEDIFGELTFGTLSQYKQIAAIDHAEMLKYFHFDLSFLKLLTSPWDLTFHHNYPWILRDNTGAAGPFLLALTPVLIFVRRWRKSAVLFGIFSLIFYLYWLVGEQIQHLRYMVSAYPVHGLVTAWGVTEVFHLDKFTVKNKAHVAAIVLLLSLGFSFFYRTTTPIGQGATNIKFLDESRKWYLAAQLTEYIIIDQIINTQIQKGKDMVASGNVDSRRLVLTDETRIYGLSCEGRRFLIDCHLIGGLFGYADHAEFMEHASSSQELYDWLNALGCDFLLVNEAVAERQSYRIEIELPYDDLFPERFEEIARMGHVVLYFVAGPGESGRLTGLSTEEMEAEAEALEEAERFEPDLFTPMEGRLDELPVMD